MQTNNRRPADQKTAALRSILSDKKVKSFWKVCAGVALALGVLLPLCVRAMPTANLTRNWGMESWNSPYGTYGSGWPLQVASDWHRFTQSGQEPRFMKDTVYADLFSNSGAIPRHIEGSYSQNLWLGHSFTAGIYQQIAVTPGKPYTAKAWIFTACGSSVSNPDGKMIKQVGIDPYGGTDPGSPNVVWGEPDGRDKTYTDIDIRSAAWAKNSTVTCFVRVSSPYDVYPDWNAAWIDAVVLAQAPTVSASSPEFSASTSFTVSWNNAQAALGWTLTGQYDVQYKDGADGQWVTWKSKKTSTQDTFVGQPGHTYYFRARAWQEYAPEGIELYGAYSEQGDTHTTVGRAVTGYVRGNTGYAVPGVTVAISETANSTVTDGQGRYQLLLAGVGSFHVLANSPYYRSPPPLRFTVGSDTFVVPITITVRPLDDVVVNGDFETALSGSWTASGSPVPQIQSLEVRSGQNSLRLVDGTTGSPGSRIEQSFSVAGMYKPVLSFYIKAPQLGNGAHLLVGRSSPLLTIASPYPEWSHFYVPLDLAQIYTGTIQVFFQASSSSTMKVYIDEVSVGRSPGGPIKTYCPIVLRESAP